MPREHDQRVAERAARHVVPAKCPYHAVEMLKFETPLNDTESHIVWRCPVCQLTMEATQKGTLDG